MTPKMSRGIPIYMKMMLTVSKAPAITSMIDIRNKNNAPITLIKPCIIFAFKIVAIISFSTVV